MNPFDTKNPPFHRLSDEGQHFLAAWMVLTLSEPLSRGEEIPADMTHALADLAASSGLRRPRAHYAHQQLVPDNKKRNAKLPWRVSA